MLGAREQDYQANQNECNNADDHLSAFNTRQYHIERLLAGYPDYSCFEAPVLFNSFFDFNIRNLTDC
jgi:hypothetical protein